MRKFIKLFMVFWILPVQSQEQLEESSKALTVIGDFAKSMCADPAYKGSSNEINAGIKANAEVKNLLKRLADLNIEVSANAKRQAFEGLLQKDLLEATKDAARCRLEIYNDLKDRLLPRKNSSPGLEPSTGQDKPTESRAALGFNTLKEMFGLPAESNIGWGTSYEEVESLIPPSQRSISRVDVLATKGLSSINGVPASTQFFFEQRKLSSVRLVIDASYGYSDLGNMQTQKIAWSRVDGDQSAVKKICNAAFISAVERRADNIFSKTSNLEAKRVAHSDYVPRSYECDRYKCDSESYSDSWAAGYKHAEANSIELEHVIRTNKYSYRKEDYYSVGTREEVSCITQFRFSNKKLGGI